MILLRRLGGPLFALNPDLIERAEATPDTVVTMVNGNKYLVCESLTEMTELIRDHRARIIATAESMAIDSSSIAQSAARGNAPHLHDVSAHTDNAVVPIRSREA
ncbi:flagellar FlbD family protein [Jatrophihabitans telluris]|uniref:Flagellar FlbD family protein n=1 Tax=Jatrophihabitans telluris TaxID=2038343 RepID=A0ABY4QX72_9ACTN|nr:flagellar FlbD family protein [Jatrophihabitans telluris]UQX87959.1 flagellar FlbD family protein [Jatrophihabitans telluris]